MQNNLIFNSYYFILNILKYQYEENVFRDVIFMELKVTVGNLIEIAANYPN